MWSEYASSSSPRTGWSTHLPPECEHGHEVDEEVIVAFREQADHDPLSTNRARLEASDLDEVVGAGPDVSEELAP